MTMWPAGHSGQVGELKDLLPDDFSAGDIKCREMVAMLNFKQLTYIYLLICELLWISTLTRRKACCVFND